MGSTPKYNLPYPELTDSANVPRDVKALAEAVELAQSPGAVLTDAVTASTGWAVTEQSAVKLGALVVVAVNATRTGAAIVSPSTGDIGNVTVASINLSRFGATAVRVSGGLTVHGNGRLVGGYVTPGGFMQLAATLPGVSIATNGFISLVGLIIVA
jgi:hypothetical protein